MAAPIPITQSLSTGLSGSAMLQRKSGCACGGGCPRCQENLEIQPKLKISEPGDPYEQEADRVADEVMRMPDPSVQPQMEPEEDGEEMVQTKSFSPQEAAAVCPTKAPLADQLNSRQGQGISLPHDVRSFMEPRFGHDFSQVRVHTDHNAAQMNKALHSQAFTYQRNIYFGAGQSPGKDALMAHELTHVIQQVTTNPNQTIARKLSVSNFDQPIPNPNGQGLNQEKGDAVFDYVNTLCPDAAFMIQSGNISFLEDSFCQPSDLTPDGLLSPAEASKKSTSCTCLCDIIQAPDDVKINIDDNVGANTHFEPNGGTITVPSPNNKSIPKVQGASGAMLDSPPFIVFAHELCGHYLLNMQGVDERENLSFIDRGGHDPAIKRENLIRQEHGLDMRGTFRDPCCGIGNPTPADLLKSKGKCGDSFQKLLSNRNSVAFECKHWRDEYNQLNGTNFTTDDAIPNKPGEKLPAQWRVEVLFKKDAPQPWLTLLESLTEEGKNRLDFVMAALNKRQDMHVQITGNASSDKPQNDLSYNKNLALRRAKFIFDALVRAGVSKERFQSFDETCDKVQEGVHNCGDEKSESNVDQTNRNVEVKIFNP